VVVPSIHQVLLTPKRIRFESEARIAGRSLAQLIDWNAPEIRLRRFFDRERIEAILLLDAFREISEAGGQLYSRDRHLDRAGHELAAETIVGALTERREAPSSPIDFLHPKPSGWGPEDDPSWLDFAARPHSKHVGDGFAAWQSAAAEQPGGWLMLGEGVIALRSAEGALVVRGQLAAAAELEIGIVGVAGERVSVPEAGPFEARLVLAGSRSAALPRYVAVGIRVVGEPTPVWIKEVGFEIARPSS